MHRPAAALLAALLFSAAGTASADTYVVTQEGISFNPQTVIITQGDVVRWVWTASSHTVTSGSGSSDPNVGTLFDDPLDPSHLTFEYTFDAVGSFPYFCRPHEFFGMTGTVVVDEPTSVEPTTWGTIKKKFGRGRDEEE